MRLRPPLPPQGPGRQTPHATGALYVRKEAGGQEGFWVGYAIPTSCHPGGNWVMRDTPIFLA